MRIAFFVHRYAPAVGGVENYIRNLARALIDLGHEIDVITGAHEMSLPDEETLEGVRIHRFPALRSPLRVRFRLWQLRRVFTSADVVHVSNTHMFELYWRMIGKWLRLPNVFLTRHGMSCKCPVPPSEKRRAVQSLRRVAGVVHDGAFIEKWLGVSPDICPDQGLCPTADELDPVPEPPPTSAVYIGRLEPDTGIEIYIDAVRLLTSRQGRPFKLDVYGDGSLRPSLRAMVQREGLPVCFRGRIQGAQERITDSCFAFIDGRMAIQEAMARRRLVLAAYVNPLKKDYLCGEPFSPHLVAVETADELAHRTAHFIDHPDRRAAITERAFVHARTLTWRRTAAAYLTLWREKLGDPSRLPARRVIFGLSGAINGESRAPITNPAAGTTASSE